MADELFKALDAPAESTLSEELGLTGQPTPDLPIPASPAPGRDIHAIIISVCSQKDEVEKTTATINPGAALVELGHKVLLVDFDPQGSSSVGLDVNPHTSEHSVYSLLLSREYMADEVIQPIPVEGMDTLPGSIDLPVAEMQLAGEVVREWALDRLLEPLRGEYDFIFVDCVPRLGLLTINALTASDYVTVPLECKFFTPHGIVLLADIISKVPDRLSPNLRILGILGIIYDRRALHSREVLERVIQAPGDDVFHTAIRYTVKFPETTAAGEPIATYASASKETDAYRMLARKVLRKCR